LVPKANRLGTGMGLNLVASGVVEKSPFRAGVDRLQRRLEVRAQVTSTSGAFRWTDRLTCVIELTTQSATADSGQKSK